MLNQEQSNRSEQAGQSDLLTVQRLEFGAEALPGAPAGWRHRRAGSHRCRSAGEGEGPGIELLAFGWVFYL